MMKKKLIVSKIRNGIVIDHIPAGRALKVLKILGITGDEGLRVALVMNVESKKYGKKDIVKIEEKFLSLKELSLISLIAPTATINVIKEYEVVEKYDIKLPSEIKGLLKCPNPSCISRKRNEPIKSSFKLKSTNPIMLECQYCGYIMSGDEIEKYIET